MTKYSLVGAQCTLPPSLGVCIEPLRDDDGCTGNKTKGVTVDQQRFRIATRIHFALLRQFGEDVAVSTLLNGGPEAREALWVCEASNDSMLIDLAAQFKRSSVAPRPEPEAPQDAAWARNTSGFGVSQLPSSFNETSHGATPSLRPQDAATRRPR